MPQTRTKLRTSSLSKAMPKQRNRATISPSNRGPSPTQITFATDWRLKVFPQPFIVDTHPHDCGCTWAYAPNTYAFPEYPFIIKFPWRMCREHHNREYPREALIR